LSKKQKYQWRRLSASEKADFLKQLHSNAFHSEIWNAVYGDALLVFQAFLDEEVLASACLYEGKLKVFSALINPPFAPNNAFSLNIHHPKAKTIDQKKLMQEFVSAIEDERHLVKQFSFPPELIDLQAFYWEKYKITTRYTYRVKLSQGEEELLLRMEPKLRNVIRKAEKDGMRCDLSSKDEDKATAMILESNAMLGSKQQRLLKDRLNQASKDPNALFLKAYLGDVMKAAALVYANEGVYYYLFSGFERTQAHNGAGPFLIWEAIKKAKEAGARIFDFEGSMLPDIERYFRKFGGDLQPYYSVSKAPLLIEAILKLKKRNEF
jgi:hypothetical protein